MSVFSPVDKTVTNFFMTLSNEISRERELTRESALAIW